MSKRGEAMICCSCKAKGGQGPTDILQVATPAHAKDQGCSDKKRVWVWGTFARFRVSQGCKIGVHVALLYLSLSLSLSLRPSLSLFFFGNSQTWTKIAGVPKVLVSQSPELAVLKTIGFDTLFWGDKEPPKRVPNLLVHKNC